MTHSPLGRCLFISGSDTDAGKTVVTAALALTSGQVGVMKLVQAGTGDREYYQKILALDQSPTELNPLYFAAPLAPPLAAQREGRTVDLAQAWQSLTQLRQRFPRVLIEGAGGAGFAGHLGVDGGGCVCPVAVADPGGDPRAVGGDWAGGGAGRFGTAGGGAPAGIGLE